MLTIEYDSIDGIPMQDGLCLSYVWSMFHSGVTHITAGSENIILAARVLVKQESIPHLDIQFKFEGRTMKINPDGRIVDPPEAFGRMLDRFYSALL